MQHCIMASWVNLLRLVRIIVHKIVEYEVIFEAMRVGYARDQPM
jgi:hypothetical protein